MGTTLMILFIRLKSVTMVMATTNTLRQTISAQTIQFMIHTPINTMEMFRRVNSGAKLIASTNGTKSGINMSMNRESVMKLR